MKKNRANQLRTPNVSRNGKKIGKKFSRRILLIPVLVLVLVFAVTAVVFFIPRDNTSFSFECWQLRRTVSGFLDDLCDGDFDSAAKKVYFVSPQGAPVDATEEVLRSWSSRMQELKSGVRNNFLSGYSDLSVRKENGTMTVTVMLDVELQGYGDPFFNDLRTVYVISDGGDWKICGITDEELQTPFEQAVSGVVSVAESDPAEN